MPLKVAWWLLTTALKVCAEILLNAESGRHTASARDNFLLRSYLLFLACPVKKEMAITHAPFKYNKNRRFCHASACDKWTPPHAGPRPSSVNGPRYVVRTKCETTSRRIPDKPTASQNQPGGASPEMPHKNHMHSCRLAYQITRRIALPTARFTTGNKLPVSWPAQPLISIN